LKKASRYIMYILIGTLLFAIVAILLLQLPAVQTSILNKVNTSLSKKLGNKISIKNVDIDYLNRVDLDGIYLEDLKGDTLAYIKQMKVAVSLWGLVKNELLITDATINGANIQFKKDDLTEKFNYQFLIDAFSPENNTEKDKTLLFDLDNIDILNTQFELLNGEDKLEANLMKLAISFDYLDFDNKKVLVDDFLLEEADVQYIYLASKNKTRREIQFPNLPWQIQANDISTSKVNFLYKEKNSVAVDDVVTFDNLNLKDINFDAQDIRIDSTQIAAQISTLSFQEQSGFELEDFKTGINITQKGIDINELNLQTPQSNLSTSTTLSFQQFSDLKNIKNINIKSVIDKTRVSIKDVRYFTDARSKNIFSNIPLNENIVLDGELEGSVHSLQMKHLDVHIPGIVDSHVNGTLKNILDKQTLSFDLRVDQFETSSKKLGKIIPHNTLPVALDKFGNVDIEGTFLGDLKSFSVEGLSFDSEASTNAQLSGTVLNLLDPEQLSMDLKIEKLETHLDDIQGFVKGGLPPAIQGAGAISYIGDFTGTLKDFELDGKLKTDIGNAETNVELKFDNSATGPSYSGAIQLQEFDLGAVLNNDDFGVVNLSIDADGSGLDLNAMDSKMKMNVEQLTYKNVLYENFAFNGTVEQKKINGDFDINTPNAIAQFNGLLDLNGDQAKMNFTLNVDTVSLQAMNITKTDLAFSGDVQVSGEGQSIDDFMGVLNIDSLHMTNNGQEYHTKNLHLESTETKDLNRKLVITADDMNATLEGKFTIAALPVYTKQLIDKYIPIDWFYIEEEQVKRELNTSEIFTVDLNIENEDFLKLWVPKLENLDSLYLKTNINSDKDRISINGNIRAINYDGIQAENVRLLTYTSKNKIKNYFIFDNCKGIANFVLPNSEVNAVLQKDSLLVKTEILNDTLGNILRFGGNLTNMDGIYNFNFDDDLKLDSTLWKIDHNNSIRFKKDFLDIKSLKLNKNEQRLVVESEGSNLDGKAPIRLQVDQFNIHELTNLMAFDNDFLYGTANGDLIVQDLFTDPTYSGDLAAEELILNSKSIGDIDLIAAKRTNSSIMDLELSLAGKGNHIDGKGTLDLNTNAIDFKSSFNNLDISIFEPYIEKIVSDSEGSFDGDVHITGSTKKPIINGKIKTNEIITTVNFSKTRYQLSNQNISIDDSKFSLDNLTLIDDADRRAVINGAINHSSFKDFYYDLDINTGGFQILNTTLEDNPLFYGDLILSATASVTGPLKLPQLNVNANSLSGTNFHLSPFAESSVISQDDYIIFTPNNTATDSLQSIVYELKNNLPLDLKLNLTLDKNTEFQFILDPNSGDKLTCFGDANLQVVVSPEGQIDVFGTYTVDNGKYNFSYGVIKKEFDITQGGTVVFQGDPLLAKINVEAAYNTKATPIAIIDNPSDLSESETSLLQKRTDVQVGLNIDGTINSPDLNFDLKFVENDIQNNQSLSRKVNEIRNNEEDLYKQVFGLILFNTFVSADESTLSTVSLTTGSNIALRSVSGFVEDQLNQLASKFIKGFEFNVNIDSHLSEFIKSGSTSVTEFKLAASKSFANDRITVQALGNVDLDNRTKGAALSSIAGDFILQYKLNKKGNITLEAFLKSDFDVLLEENTNKQGLGISLQKALHLRNKSK